MDLETCLKQFTLAYQFRLNPSTVKIYKCAINQFYEYSEKNFDTVTKSDIRNWLNNLSTEKEYKPSTLNNKIAGLKVFFKYCQEEGLILQDPAKGIKFVYEEEKLPRYLLMEQLVRLRAFLEGQIQERAMVEVLYTTGVRIHELFAMEKEDINWSERTIVIPEGKGKAGRIVLFTSECAIHLKAYWESRTDHSPFVFVISNTNGTSSNDMNIIEEWFRYYSNRLGFKVTPHTLRHTFAAHLAYKGMPLECIQELMGHQNFHTTRIYAKLYDHVRKEKYDEWM